jgi:hypothetical protein
MLVQLQKHNRPTSTTNMLTDHHHHDITETQYEVRNSL